MRSNEPQKMNDALYLLVTPHFICLAAVAVLGMILFSIKLEFIVVVLFFCCCCFILFCFLHDNIILIAIEGS